MAIVQTPVDIVAVPNPVRTFFLGMAVFASTKASQILLDDVAGFGHSLDSAGEVVTHLVFHLLALVAVLLLLNATNCVRIGVILHLNTSEARYLGVWCLSGFVVGFPAMVQGCRLGSLLSDPTNQIIYAAEVLYFCCWAPVVEEVMFRGLIFSSIRTLCSAASYPASIGLFILWHASFRLLLTDGDPGLGMYQIILASWTGVATSWLYVRTGNLVVPILYHAISNLVLELAPPIGYLLSIGKS